MVGIPIIRSWQTLLSWLCKRLKRKALLTTIIKLAWCATIYHIWKERNNRLHNRFFSSELSILEMICADVRDHVLGFAKPRMSPMPHNIAVNWGLEILCTDRFDS
ncbi:hypothetical protein SLA2020_509890 [Shorea laevis]